MNKSIILDNENFVLVGEDDQQRIFGVGLPGEIIESALFFNFQRN